MSTDQEIQTQGRLMVTPALCTMHQSIGPHAAAAFSRGVIAAGISKMITTVGKEATFEFLSRCADEIGTAMIEAKS